MKNRKTVVTAFVLVAVMLMAVGFAALTDDLKISGDVNLTHDAAQEEVAKDVYFEKVDDKENCSPVISESDPNKDTIVVKINDDTSAMAVAGDEASFTATVKNDNNVMVYLTFEHHESEYFKMCVVDSNGVHTTGEDGSITVAADGGTTDITVKIEMLKNVPDDGLTVKDDFYITVTASTVSPVVTP